METDRREARNKNLWLMIGFLAVGLLVMFFYKPLGIGGIGLVLIFFLIKYMMNAFDDYDDRQFKLIRRAEKGAIAEEKIGDLLDRLDDHYVVLHDIVSPYGNIDHVVISEKGGILLLETKSHYGKTQLSGDKILVNGKIPEKDFVMQALRNSYWVREQIETLLQVKPWITPILVFTNAFVPFGKPVKGVRVTNSKFLLEIIQDTVSRSSVITKIWENRNEIICLLTGEYHNRAVEQPAITTAKVCPNCGKTLITRVAQRGPRKGMTLMVCPDYPGCYTTLAVN